MQFGIKCVGGGFEPNGQLALLGRSETQRLLSLPCCLHTRGGEWYGEGAVPPKASPRQARALLGRAHGHIYKHKKAQGALPWAFL